MLGGGGRRPRPDPPAGGSGSEVGAFVRRRSPSPPLPPSLAPNRGANFTYTNFSGGRGLHFLATQTFRVAEVCRVLAKRRHQTGQPIKSYKCL